MERCIQTIVEKCSKSPLANNVLFRLVAFGTELREVHGFKPFEQCDVSDYNGFYQSGGCTALYDSAENTEDGRALKWLSIVDEYTRECLALEVERGQQLLTVGISQHVGPGAVVRIR